jgi:hypothetical protein
VIDHDAIPEGPPNTWALMTAFESQSPEGVEEALRKAVDDSIPAARDLPGCKGALALATESRRHGVVIVFWDSVQSLVASARAQQDADGGSPPGVTRTRDRFEVVYDVRPDE